jgi:hypothetical protein
MEGPEDPLRQNPWTVQDAYCSATNRKLKREELARRFAESTETTEPRNRDRPL